MDRTKKLPKHRVIEVVGERLTLLPEKMIWLESRQTLLVADTHFGKANTFRRVGIPVPEAMTISMLTRLSGVIEAWKAKRLLVLGDFIHSAVPGKENFEADLLRWRDECPDLEILLVLGNHDRGQQQLFERLSIGVVNEPHVEKPFAFCHYPEVDVVVGGYRIAGHVHPAIRFSDDGASSEKVACFLFTDDYAILPAFGEFTGCHTVKPGAGDRVYVVAEGEVIELSRTRNIPTRPGSDREK